MRSLLWLVLGVLLLAHLCIRLWVRRRIRLIQKGDWLTYSDGKRGLVEHVDRKTGTVTVLWSEAPSCPE